MFLVQDPDHEYAIRFIEDLYTRRGHRAVCYFTDRRRRFQAERALPMLRSDAVAAVYDVDLADVRGFARRAATVHPIRGVIPYNEECVLSAAEIDDELALRWNAVDVVRRFRDKFGLKEHLRQTQPTLRMNGSLRAHTAEEAVLAVRSFSRSVLKPNAGFGNREVTFFDADTPRARIEERFACARGAPIVVEEYVGGREYFVNGQVDARGEVTIIAIFAYTRVAANGRDNLDYRADLVRRDMPEFTALADYATGVVRASGLLRSPFHLEAKIDDEGPCLIEVGARLSGLRNAFVCNYAHGGALDVFDLAAHYYLSDVDYGPIPLRWDIYDRLEIRYVSGIACDPRRSVDPRAIAAIESLPTFQSWAKRPAIGGRTDTTVDCLSMPWSVVLAAAAGTSFVDDEARVREILEARLSRVSPRLARANAKKITKRVTDKMAWQLARVEPPRTVNGKQPRGFLDRIGALPVVDRAARKLQEAHLGRHYADRLQTLSPQGLKAAADILAWSRSYLAQPHPELGRKGPVCPFIAKTIANNGLFITVHEEVERSAHQIRDVVLSHADAFRRRYRATEHDTTTSLIIVLPNVPEEAFDTLDAVHEQVKTYLMKRRIMVAAIHARSTRPAIWNPAFPVLRSPIPCFAVRHMVVQDIAFVGHNREAFATYDRLFRPLFRAKKVSNEFGYVEMYENARARFGV
jgi:hypothetical protein